MIEFKSKNAFWLIQFPKLMTAVFIIMQVLAMTLYPGSTYLNNSAEHYIFTQNFLSDLGRYYTFKGELNIFSFILFNCSLIIVGITFIIFFIKIQKLFINDQINIRLSKAGTLFAILGSLCMIGVACTPSDLLHKEHVFFADYIFRFYIPAALLYSIAMYRLNGLDNKYSLGYLLFSIFVFLYVLQSIYIPKPFDNNIKDLSEKLFYLSIHVVNQKLIIFIFIFAVLHQVYGIESYLKKDSK